jgi:hypothetical protein
VPGFPHRVGIELAPDPDLVAARRRALGERADVAVRDRAFDEDRADAALHEQVDEFGDPVQPRLAFGRDALDADDLEAVGGSEVVERVMRGQEYARGLGDGAQNLVRIGRKPRDFRQMRGLVGAEGLLALGMRQDERVGDRAHDVGPEIRVHPDVRVETVGIVVMPDAQFLGHRLGHGHDLLALPRSSRNSSSCASR